MRRGSIAALARGAAVAAALWLCGVAGPAQAQGGAAGLGGPGCDPGLAAGMEKAALAGVRRQAAIVRNPVGGVRDPGSLFDFSCIDRFLDPGRLSVHVSMGGLIGALLGRLEEKVCELADRVYAMGVTRALDGALFRADLPRLPGLELDVRRGAGAGLDFRGRPVRPGDRWSGRRFDGVLDW